MSTASARSRTDVAEPTERPRSIGLSERAVVEAALELIAERGVVGLTMRELSSRLGVALGATYKHVPNKHVLLTLVIHDLYARVDTGPPVADGFEQAKRALLAVRDVLAPYPGVDAYLSQHLEVSTDTTLARELYDPLRAAGLSRERAALVARSMVQLFAGFTFLRLPGESKDDADAAFAAGLDLILAGARADLTTSG